MTNNDFQLIKLADAIFKSSMLHTNDPKEALEAIVDYSGLFETLEMLEVICEEKAEHVRSDWQDLGLALQWLKAAKAISKFKMNNRILAV